LVKPFASVLIDTYNHERFIERAIVSALEQDFPASDREVVVVDDGSTDGTAEILRKFEPKVQLVRKPNGGQASAFNVGIPRCQGEIIAFLDGDDWWLPSKLQTVVRTLENEPNAGAVGHAIYEVNEAGAIRATVQPNRAYRSRLRGLDDVREFLPLRAFLGTSRFTARRTLLDRILPIPEEISVEADEFLFTMAAALTDVVVLPQPLAHYRLHSGNLYQFGELDRVRMQSKQKALASLVRQLQVHLQRAELPEEVIDLLLQSTWIDAERLRLSLGDGWPWDSFRVERAAYRMAHLRVSLLYRFFQAAALSASLFLPPKLFYALRKRYSGSGWLPLRARLADATPADTTTVRCVERQ
jgi:glycosyltransferase involved in cell wall biosynthesis